MSEEMNVPVFAFDDKDLADAWEEATSKGFDDEVAGRLCADAALIAEFDGELASAKTPNDLMMLTVNYHLNVEHDEYWSDFYTREIIEEVSKGLESERSSAVDEAAWDEEQGEELANYKEALSKYPDADYFRSNAMSGLYGLDEAEVASEFSKLKQEIVFYFVISFGLEL